MATPFRSKWRPPLVLIIGSILVAILMLSVAILLFAWSQGDAGGPSLPAIGFHFAAILLVTAGLGFVLVRSLAGPLRELTERTARLSEGDRAALEPLRQHGSRELAELSTGLFGMAGALFERSEFIATFATHVSHELKSPLTSIRGAVELLLDQENEMTLEERQRFLKNVLEDAARMEALINRMRQLAHADNPQGFGSCTLAQLETSLRTQFSAMEIHVKGAKDCELGVADENATIIFSNLLANAEQHGAKNIVINVRCGQRALIVDVQDDGAGISIGNEGRIFDLFFTTRREVGGTGMGLGIVRSMLQAHEGSVELVTNKAPQPAMNTWFRLTLPLAVD